MMRSQAEQLQNRQPHIKDYQDKSAAPDRPAGSRRKPVTGPTHFTTSTNMACFRAPNYVRRDPELLSIIEAQEDERLRISRQIHDGPTQALTNLILRAEICERLIDRDVDEARTELSSLKAMINASLQETRRMIFDLRPMILDDLGLVPTLRRNTTEISRLKDMQSIVSGPDHDIRMNTTMQVAIFRMVQTIISAYSRKGRLNTLMSILSAKQPSLESGSKHHRSRRIEKLLTSDLKSRDFRTGSYCSTRCSNPKADQIAASLSKSCCQFQRTPRPRRLVTETSELENLVDFGKVEIDLSGQDLRIPNKTGVPRRTRHWCDSHARTKHLL